MLKIVLMTAFDFQPDRLLEAISTLDKLRNLQKCGTIFDVDFSFFFRPDSKPTNTNAMPNNR